MNEGHSQIGQVNDDQRMEKLYCSVDETGQDTKGELFLVSMVISKAEREHLGKLLGEYELHCPMNMLLGNLIVE